MLHEPSKTKRYIIIGVAALFLAVLAIVVIPLFFKNKTLQTPATDLSSQEKIKQQKIQKNMQEVAKRLQEQPISEQQIKEDMNSASEEVKKLPAASPEEMQNVANKLKQLK